MELVAQWTRARGYEPRCRGFESLLAQELPITDIFNTYLKKKLLKIFSFASIILYENSLQNTNNIFKI